MIHLFTLLFLAFIATSCEMNGGELDKKNNGLTFAEGTELLAEFKARGGSATFKFTADLDWEATASEEWITVSPDKGEAGEGQIKIKAKENEELEEREGYVDITLSNDKSYRIEVEQMEGDPICELGDDGEYIVSAKGGEVEIEVTTNIEYSIFIPTSARKWISHEDTRALRTDTVILDISKNTGEKRSATIKLRDKRGETLQEITIEQKGVVSNEEEKPVFEIGDNGEYIVEVTGGDVEIEVTTNLEYDVYIPKDVEEWVEFIETRSVRNETVVLSVAVNGSEAERTAVIELRDKSGDTLEEITIVQRGEEPVFEIGDNGEYIVEAEGGDVEIEVTTNLEYSVYIPKDVEEWIELIETRSVRNETVVLSVAVNDSEAERTAVIELRDKSGDTLEEITIVQRGEEPIFEVGDNGEYIVEAEGGDVEVDVRTNLEYNVYIPKDAEEWVEYVETRSVRNETVVLSVAVNDSEKERTAVIELRDASGNTLEEITIVQRGEEPVFEVGDNGEYIVEATGGDVEIEVTTNLEYSVYIPKDVEEWVELIETRSVRNETAVLSVAENDSEKERTAVIELRDKSGNTLEEITIVQRGKSAEDEEPGSEVPNKEIWYTTTDGMEFNPHDMTGFGANLIDNTYVDGKGVLLFDGDVTTIGERAFQECSSLTSITIPDSVMEIGVRAFEYCSSLTSITIPDSVTEIGDYAFYCCFNLTSVNIPNSVTEIGDGVFEYCRSLTSITIPDSVTEIGAGAFQECSSLTSITIPDSVTAIGRSAFYGCSSLTEFKGKFASEDARCLIIDGTLNSFAPAGVTEYTIPDSVTEIGAWAFAYCSSLTSITIPDSVTTIGAYAFSGCSSLKSVYCKPTTPPSIDYGVFNNNASGRKIYVPAESVAAYQTSEGWSDYADSIAGYNFESGEVPNNEIWYTTTDGMALDSYNTTGFGANLVDNTYVDGKGILLFDGDVTAIGDWAFEYCNSLTSITIPNSVTKIGYYAFQYCSSLTSVTIGNSVTKIGENAFWDCSSLESVTIPDSVTTIGEEAFACCSSLTEFKGKFASEDGRCLIIDGTLNSFAPAGVTEYTIPDSVTEIGVGAFLGYSSLTSITIPDSVTEIGEDAFLYCRSLTSITIPDSVTAIGEKAFSVCSSLTEFKGKFASEDARCLIIDGTLNSFAPVGVTEYTIPDSVTEIGDRVFEECSSLTSITIPDSVTTIGWGAFEYCSSLTSITIPNRVTAIGGSAFYECSSLTSITIPDSVTEIGTWVFAYCSSLESVYCKPTTPPSIDNGVFENNASGRKIYVPTESVEAYKTASYWRGYADSIVGYNFVPNNEIWYTTTDGMELNRYTTTDFGANLIDNTYVDGKGVLLFDGDVTTIGGSAFYDCSSLTSIRIPNSVTTIGDRAFQNCYSLTSIIIPDSVTEIGDYAFWYCSRLTSITIPDSVTTIGAYAFEDCSSLTSITIPNSVTAIREEAFQYCSSLTSITIPDSVTTIGDSAFYGCNKLTSVTIPDSVTTIGERAFSGCSSLTSITIPNSVTTIGDGAFGFCSSLTSITIPDSITTIGESAFEVCSSLTSITIPDSVTAIGDYAFWDCSSLTSITIPDNVTTIGWSAFYECI